MLNSPRCRLYLVGVVGMVLAGCQSVGLKPPPPSVVSVGDPARVGLPGDAPTVVAIEFVAPGTPRGTVRSLAQESETRRATPDERRARAQQARTETRARQLEVAQKEVTPLGDLRHLRSRRLPDSFCQGRNLSGPGVLKTFFNYSKNSAVYVRMCANQVVDTRDRPGATPAASRAEREEAIALAQKDPRLKDHVGALRPQALVTGDCEGRLTSGRCAHRTLFVTFSSLGEEVPRFDAEVDMAERRVLRAGPSAGARSASRPSAERLTPANRDEGREVWEGDVTWRGWKFRYEMDEDEQSGLVIENVEYEGQRLIRKMSLPVIRVKYTQDSYWYRPWTWRIFKKGCGPFKDQIDRDSLRTIERPVPTPAVSDAPQPCPHAICRREWTNGDMAWLELGVYARIGQYHIYQAWYFSAGDRPGTPVQIAPVVWTGGVACEMAHTHHPYWRLHFDIDNQGKDQVFVRRGGQWSLYDKEGDDAKVSSPTTSTWLVRSQTSRPSIWLVPSPADGARDRFSNHDLIVRRYHDEEDVDWEFDFYDHLGYANGEPVDGQSNVVWYVAHLHHVAKGESTDRWRWHHGGPYLLIQPRR